MAKAVTVQILANFPNIPEAEYWYDIGADIKCSKCSYTPTKQSTLTRRVITQDRHQSTVFLRTFPTDWKLSPMAALAIGRTSFICTERGQSKDRSSRLAFETWRLNVIVQGQRGRNAFFCSRLGAQAMPPILATPLSIIQWYQTWLPKRLAP